MLTGSPVSRILGRRKKIRYLVDLLLGTKRINLVYNSSRESLKVCAELCSEEETNVLSIKNLVKQLTVSKKKKKKEIVTRICSD
jgi:hypothetical protein